MVVCLTYKEKPMKSKELPLLNDIFPDNQLNNSYEKENNWLIEIITVAAENYGYYRETEYQEKISLLKNNPVDRLSRKDLFWLADKFAWVFARIKTVPEYQYYRVWFFEIFFGKKPKKAPATPFWTHLTYVRLEQKALAKPNPTEPIFFHSGNSAKNDFLGYSMAKKSIGVQIQLCSENVKKLMLEYNAEEGRLFIDSGSFSAFRKGKQVDFNKVVKDYFYLAENAQKSELLSIVAPDVVGSQDATLKLLKQYQKELFKLICLGVDLIVPIQLGKLSLEEAYKESVTILATKAFRVGIPSNEKAISLDCLLGFVSRTKPKQIHLLGLHSTKFDNVIAQVKAISPNTHVSADATTLRAKLKKGSNLVSLIERKTNQAIEQSLSQGTNPLSYESLAYKIFNEPHFLSQNQAKHLAKLITTRQMEQERIVFAAKSNIHGFDNGSRLGDLLTNYYDKETVSKALKQFAHTLTKRAVSGTIRAAAIAQIQKKSA